MTSEISFSIENNIVMSFVTGKRTKENSIKLWQQAFDRCEQENIKKLQMNLALDGHFSPFEAINNYQSIIEIVKNRGLQIAVVDINRNSSSETQIGCNMGASQGVNVNYFNSESEAMRWLMSDELTLEKMA